MQELRPGVSVIVSTSQQRVQTELCLQALAEQTVPPFSFEVHLCDDGLEDLSVIARRFKRKLDINYHVNLPRSLDFRLASTRNIGLRNCSFERTLCIDGDIIVAPETIAIHAEYGNQLVCVTGNRRHVSEPEVATLDERVEAGERVFQAAKDLAHRDLTRHWSVELREHVQAHYGQPGHVYRDCPATWASGFQVSYPTALARRIGGFWEEFVGWGFEEREFHERLVKEGCRFDIALDLECFHLDHPSVKNAILFPKNAQLFYKSLKMSSTVRNGGAL